MNCSNMSDSSTVPVTCEQRLEIRITETKQILKELVYNEQVNQLWKLGIESILNTIWNKICSQHVCVSTGSQTNEQLKEDCDTLLKSSIHINVTSRTLQKVDNCFTSSAEQANSFSLSNEEQSKFGPEGQRDIVNVIPSISSAAREKEVTESRTPQGQPTKRVRKFGSSSWKACNQRSRCESKFSRKDGMSLRERSHVEPVSSSTKCDICLRVFTNRGNLATHMRFCLKRQKGNGPYGSTERGKLSHTKDKLKIHSSCHEEKKYKCSVCGHAFTRPNHVTRHMLIHTRVKPFRCKLCQKSFARTDYLRYHTRTYHIKKQENT